MVIRDTSNASFQGPKAFLQVNLRFKRNLFELAEVSIIFFYR